MAQDAVGGAPRVAVMRQPLKSAASRIIPAIPHALNHKRRPKQQQAAPGAIEFASEAQSTSAQEAISVPDVEVAGHAESTDGAGHEPVELLEGIPTPPVPLVPVADEAVLEEALAPAIVGAETESQEDMEKEEEPQEEPAPSPPTEMIPQTQTLPPTSMRELPPPFYPAVQLSQASSTASTSIQLELPSSITVQPPRPDGNSLVFGGNRDSANSSPAPLGPHGAPHVPVSGYPGPSMNAATFYPTAQSYAGSEPHAIPQYPPPYANGGGPGRDYYHHQLHFNQPRLFYPQVQRYPSGRRPDEYVNSQRFSIPPRGNGYPHPSYNSQHPSYPFEQASAIHPDIASGQRYARESVGPGEQHLGQPSQSDVIEPSARRPSETPAQTSPQDRASMAQYIHSQFGSREFADYVVQLSHSKYLFPSTTLAAHGIILARSPKLRSLMAMQHGGYQGQGGYPRFLNITLSDRFLSHDAGFMKAIMRLYGEPFPDKNFVSKLPISSNQQGPESNEQEGMRFALTYAAAGHFLQMDEIITHGLNLAARLLTWETVGSALGFAMEGGLSSTFLQFEATSEDKGSTSSFDDSTNKLDSPVSAPSYGIYSDRMLYHVIGFLVHTCPTNFTLHPAAPQLHDIPRLPEVAEPKHVRSNSRFSQIRFGDMTHEEDSPPDATTAAMSSVLLSLPHPLLKHIFESNVFGERLGWSRVAEVVRAVVQERELRRLRAMAGRGNATPYSAVEERLWRNVRWAETVDPADQIPSGVRLSRHVVGVETPVSGASTNSGAAS